VLTAGLIVAAYANRDLIRIKIASVYAPVSPKPAPPQGGGPRPAQRFLADASWALSVLPECWQQAAKSTGDARYVRAHLPPGSVRADEGTTIRSNDCELRVGRSDAIVARGTDRLRLPAPTLVFRSPERLSILHLQGNRAELRTYIQAQ